MMDVYQKVTELPLWYMVLDLHPGSDDRKRVFSHLLTHEGYLRWHRRKRGCLIIEQNGILKISLTDSAHLKHAVLGES